tara:strand:- start:8688 stop:9323 length:636 start_codon:yes stop_codon:yes gene_type:complete
MSRSTMPYHRRYHQDALQGYMGLTLEERGAYTTIIDLIYDRGGPIPRNERWLAGAMDCSIRKVRSLLSALLTARKIYITADGKISNHRCEAELENSLKISRKRAENASKPRRNDSENRQFRNNINGDDEQMHRGSAVIPVPEPYISSSLPSEEEDRPAASERTRSVSKSPPIPPERLTGNVRLLEALEHRPQHGQLHAMLAGQRSRRGGGR